MNSSQFMDKQIMDRQGFHKNNDFIELLNDPSDAQNGSKKEEYVPSYEFKPIRPIGTSQSLNLDNIRPWSSAESKSGSTLRNYGSVEPSEPEKSAKVRCRDSNDMTMVSEIDRTMKKHADNLLHALEGVSARLTQLESRTCHLEISVDDLKGQVGNNHGSNDGRLRQLEIVLREVQTGVQVLNDKQEIAEAHLQLSKLQASKSDQPTENTNATQADAFQAAIPQILQPLPQKSHLLSRPPPEPENQSPQLPRESLFPPPGQQPEASHPHYPPSQQPAPPPQHYQPSPQLPQYSQPPPQLQQHQPPPFPQCQPPLASLPPPSHPHHPPEETSYVPPHASYLSGPHQPAPLNQPPPPLPQCQPPLAFLPPPSHPHHPPDEASYVPPHASYLSGPHQPTPLNQPSGPSPSQQFYGPTSQIYEPSSSRPGSGQSPYPRGYGPPSGPNFNDNYTYTGYTPSYNSSTMKPPQLSPAPTGRNNYPHLPTAQILPHVIPTASSISSGSGLGTGNRVPIDDVIDRVTSMGFPRDMVRATVKKLTENGQSVDLNVVLDKLMNGGEIQPQKGWFGR